MHFALWRWKVRHALERIGVGLRYACGRSTVDDWSRLSHDSQVGSSCYGLSYFSADDVVESLIDLYGDNQAFQEMAERAARRVWNKWNGTGDETGAAIDWAVDLVKEYAAEDGVELVERSRESQVPYRLSPFGAA